MRLYDLLKAAGLEPPRERAEWEIEERYIEGFKYVCNILYF